MGLVYCKLSDSILRDFTALIVENLYQILWCNILINNILIRTYIIINEKIDVDKAEIFAVRKSKAVLKSNNIVVKLCIVFERESYISAVSFCNLSENCNKTIHFAHID